MISKPCLRGWMVLALAAACLQAEPAKAETMHRRYDPVQVPGTLLEKFHGRPLDSLRLFALRKGRMIVIPFQIDERLPEGTYILNLGKKNNLKKANHVLDPEDLLVFRVCDTGPRADKKKWPVSEGIEIELEDPLDGGRSYCYLFAFAKNPPPLSPVDTVRLEQWNPWKKDDLPFIVRGSSYRIEGMVNKVFGRVYKTAINKSFVVPPEAGGTGVNILDSMRVRAFCELFFGEIRIDVNETNIIGGIDAITQGPIRGFGRQWFAVALPMGLEGPRLYCDVFTYDRMVVSPILVKVPFDPKYILTRFGVTLGYDLSPQAFGMRFYSPNCLEGVTIDGKMTEKEKSLPTEVIPWYVVTGPQGTLLLRVRIEDKLLEQVDARFEYIDDLNQSFPPDEIPGSIGYTRSVVVADSVNPGVYKVRVEWYFPPHFYQAQGLNRELLQEFLNITDAPLLIRAGGNEAENHALDPPPLIPGTKTSPVD